MLTRSRFLISVTIIVLLVSAKPASSLAESDAVCGPRCVQFVLHQYGQEVQLLDLVKELQWPDIGKGCSLADLEKALTRRGLETLLVNTSDPQATLRCADYAIAHLASAKQNELGHFVVVKDVDPHQAAIVFSGKPAGLDFDAGLASRLSGNYLLVSRKPIVLNGATAASGAALSPPLMVAAVFACVAVVTLLLRKKFPVLPFRPLLLEENR